MTRADAVDLPGEVSEIRNGSGFHDMCLEYTSPLTIPFVWRLCTWRWSSIESLDILFVSWLIMTTDTTKSGTEYIFKDFSKPENEMSHERSLETEEFVFKIESTKQVRMQPTQPTSMIQAVNTTN